MKLNWKVLITLFVLVAAIIWGVNSLRSYSYSGTNLNVNVGSGPITVMNPSNEALPVSLVSASPGTIAVSSSTPGIAGLSTSQGSGRNTGQLYDFELQPGETTFTVTRGANVNFVANVSTPLELVVYPLNSGNAQITLLVAVIAIFGSLYFLSRMNGHRWMSATRRQKAVDLAASQQAERENFKRIYRRAGSGKS